MLRVLLLSVLATTACFAQQQNCPSQEKSVPASRLQVLQHGVNIGRFLNGQLDNEGLAKCEKGSCAYSLDNLKHIGADHVRILLEPGEMFDTLSSTLPGPSAALKNLDDLVDQFVNAQLGVILALSIDEKRFQNTLATNTQLQKEFAVFWKGLAGRYSSAAYAKLVFFETLNEPGLYDASFYTDYKSWPNLQAQFVSAIRCAAPNSTILAVGAENSDVNGLLSLQPVAGDGNIVYVFHYYEPYSFTHQGETWTTGSYAQALDDVPYPYSGPEAWAAAQNITNLVEKRNALLDMLVGTKDLFDTDLGILEQWSIQNKAPILCDEFGVHKRHPDSNNPTHMIGASASARLAWIRDAKKSLEDHHIGWTFWDYSSGSFGAWSGKDKQPEDADVIRALGFQLPK